MRGDVLVQLGSHKNTSGNRKRQALSARGVEWKLCYFWSIPPKGDVLDGVLVIMICHMMAGSLF